MLLLLMIFVVSCIKSINDRYGKDIVDDNEDDNEDDDSSSFSLSRVRKMICFFDYFIFTVSLKPPKGAARD
ncbi:MAG: hypothetical protein ACI8RD_008835 [Bacillariaceae sp.]|jgi:hypothetical protein